MRKFVAGLLLLLPIGCETPQPEPAQHRVPQERRFTGELSRPSHRRNCAITITREKGVSGRGLNVFLDGDQVARIAAGESLTIYVKPGRHSIGLKPLFTPPSKRVCVLGQGESASINIVDRNGKDELEPGAGPWLALTPQSPHSLGQ